MSEKALIIGRFQPFHLGHLKMIEWAANEVEKLIIGIGSSQESHTLKNPFTASERREMIERSLKTRFRYEIYEIPDVNNDDIWVSHVRKLVPDFDVVYTNSDWVRDLFEREGFVVRGTPLFKPEVYSGTEVRKRMIGGKDWQSLVPLGTIEVIKEINGVERLKRLFREYSKL
ncbi:MAG: nicotinamide-nucleotide adenylyltransferase [Candidatus Altiarchaeales archaeon]|nr:MAG: nicotinamide-nucleotide adenylyltransferase [Candidatus Altiarchaeales archaeon]